MTLKPLSYKQNRSGNDKSKLQLHVIVFLTKGVLYTCFDIQQVTDGLVQ